MYETWEMSKWTPLCEVSNGSLKMGLAVVSDRLRLSFFQNYVNWIRGIPFRRSVSSYVMGRAFEIGGYKSFKARTGLAAEQGKNWTGTRLANESLYL
jgi:hypothetical protein